jgi:type II secretion system protein E
MAVSKVLLGELFVQRGLITAQQLDQALALQREDPRYLGQILVSLGWIAEERLLPVLAEQAGISYVSLRGIVVEPKTLARVPAKFASRYHLLPLAFDNGSLRVAVADPFDVQALDELKLLLGCELVPLWASQREIQEAIQRHYGVGASAVQRLLDTGARQEERAVPVAEDLTAAPDDASVISFVNQLILSAARDRSTDIHIEPFDQTARVRQRIDGVMYDVPVPPDLIKLHPAIVSRIKVMAQLDIAERRLPQDGRVKARLEGQDLDLRISILPTSFGETVEIRLLSSQMLYSLEQLGLDGEELTALTQLIRRPYGIIFVTGPTGSGKTTTLYACLSRLNSPHVKILTIEDPVEYQLTGITQLQVHPKIGFSFAQGLRSMLRHDPDIMMIGEVRDPETAEITIRSALTGHLVFSTLHTNDAAGGITRLLDMGIEPYLVASSVLCFIAQRLVRVVCPACAEQRPAEAALAEEFGLTRGELPSTLRYGRGCGACKGTGYQGRTAIYEFLPVAEPIQQLILQRAAAQQIARAAQAKGQMHSLRHDGWQKILRGLTTPPEVLRVT